RRRIGCATVDLTAQQKQRYEAELEIDVPPVIDAEAIESLGEPTVVNSSTSGSSGSAISSGQASGPVQVLHNPHEAGALGVGYVLVVSRSVPAWIYLIII